MGFLSWLGRIRLWELALAAFLGFGCYFLWSSTQSEKQIASQVLVVTQHLDGTLTKIDGAVGNISSASTQLSSSLKETSSAISSSSAQLNAVLAKVMAPCAPEKGHVYTADEDKPCGTLADVSRTLNTFRGFAGTLEYAGIHLDKSLTTYDQQEKNISDQTIAMLENVNSTVAYAKWTMEQHQQLLDNLQRLAGNTADTMANARDITSDLRVQTKKLNEPKTKTQKVLEWAPPVIKLGMAVTCALLGPC